jgi:predicted nucleotidyltransferase
VNSSVIDSLAIVAKQLEAIGLTDIVFVGGATIGLLITDPAAPEARYTLDVDVVTPVPSRSAFNAIETRLREAGFTQPTEGLICRWDIAGIIVDLMPPDEKILGFSNRWYKDLIDHAETKKLPDGTVIRIVSTPYLIATKLEAFHGRGKGDYRFSHDLEDIIILIDGRDEVAAEIQGAPADVRAYIAQEFGNLLADLDFREAVSEHLPPDPASQARAELVLERMEGIRRQASGS